MIITEENFKKEIENGSELHRKYVSEKLIYIDEIILTTDIFRIDDRQKDQFYNPQRINVDWLEKLVLPLIKGSLGVSRHSVYYGDEGGFKSTRWKLYSSLSLPMESSSWASLYEEIDPIYLDKLFEGGLEKKLIIGFELSPAIIRYLESKELPYIDFTIHPIRFLPDYMFGVRTNVREWEERISSMSLREEIFYDFARVSASRTSRIMRSNLPEKGSALFLGQLTLDASLIHDGELLDDEYLENQLIQLTSVYPKVYFKSHPHCKEQDKRKKIISKIKNCDWIEVNIYDALACDNFSLITAISSGGVIEAKYFGRDAKWMSEKVNYFDTSNVSKHHVYWPIYQDSLAFSFWMSVFNKSQNHIHTTPNALDGALKFSLNMKWGR